jgi:hypothetical protein
MKKTKYFILTCFLLTTLAAVADTARYVTATMPNNNLLLVSSNNVGGYPPLTYYYFAATNSIQVAAGETGELITSTFAIDFSNSGAPQVKVTKDGVSAWAYPSQTSAQGAATSHGTTVAGPATFSMEYTSQTTSPAPPQNGYGMMTVKISPMTFDPRQTVTVAPGMGNVQISLETSTNLVQWSCSTNGVYSDDLRFFRVKLTKLSP